MSHKDKRSGVICGVTSFVLWGLFPFYWNRLHEIPPLELAAHRMAWSAVTMVIVLLAMRRLKAVTAIFSSAQLFTLFFATSVLISVNWLTYIWAVEQKRFLESSLGYFINPLVYVMLGVVFLQERLTRAQLIAVTLSFFAVTYLTIQFGTVPWIALGLAGTMSTYGLLRKTAPLGALEGLCAETMLMFIPSLLFLIYSERSGAGSFLSADAETKMLIALAGPVTTVPLLLFAYAARSLRLSTVGLMQYISPTLQFFIAVLAFKEPFDSTRLLAFGAIWIALLIYSLDAYRSNQLEPSVES